MVVSENEGSEGGLRINPQGRYLGPSVVPGGTRNFVNFLRVVFFSTHTFSHHRPQIFKSENGKEERGNETPETLLLEQEISPNQMWSAKKRQPQNHLSQILKFYDGGKFVKEGPVSQRESAAPRCAAG